MNRCNRCQGSVIAEGDGSLVCIACGERTNSHADAVLMIIDSMDLQRVLQTRKQERRKLSA